MLDKKLQRIKQRIGSVPWRFLFIIFSPFYMQIILCLSNPNGPSINTSDYLMLLIVILALLGMPKYLHEYRYKRVQYTLSGYGCPHCGYSLVGLPRREDHLTECPECGIAWRLPAQRTTYVSPPYRNNYIPIGIIIIFDIFLILWLTQNQPIFSTSHLIVFCIFLYVVFLIVRKLHDDKKIHSQFEIISHQEIQSGICPACNAYTGTKMTNTDGITTCPECDAVWKLPDESSPPKLNTGFHHCHFT